MAVIALAAVERERRRPFEISFELVGVLTPVLVAAVLLINVQSDRFRRTRYLPFPSNVKADVRPFSKPRPTPSPIPTASPISPATPTSTATAPAPPPTTRPRSSSHLLLNILIFLLLLLSPLLLWLVAGVCVASSSWRRAGYRLRQGSGKQVVTGRWTWAAPRRASLGDGFKIWQLPDFLLASGSLRGDEAVTELAALVSNAAFASAAPSQQLERAAWTSAAAAWQGARRASPWWRRAWSDVRSARTMESTR